TSVRWTAIGFQNHTLTYSPAPASITSGGQPVWATGTAVQVCGVAVAADDGSTVAGAKLLLRGVSVTADGNGLGCVKIAASTSVRTVSFTAHALHGTVSGNDITSSVDVTTVLNFVTSP